MHIITIYEQAHALSNIYYSEKNVHFAYVILTLFSSFGGIKQNNEVPITVCELGLEYGVWAMEFSSKTWGLQARMALQSMFCIPPLSQCLRLNFDIEC